MTFTTVMLQVHDIGKVAIEDYVSDGKFVGIGTLAAGAIAKRQAVHYVTQAGVETVIPFHAISGVIVGRRTGEYTKPEDDFCYAPDCPSAPPCSAERPEVPRPEGPSD